jgi:hypothetical protein
MQQHACETCPMRAKYDKNPKSFAARFWRWHIGFCPGWKKYYRSLSDTQKQELKEKYRLKR